VKIINSIIITPLYKVEKPEKAINSFTKSFQREMIEISYKTCYATNGKQGLFL